ncbi:unnamed protein product, partial [Medioppia subpectinata]
SLAPFGSLPTRSQISSISAQSSVVLVSEVAFSAEESQESHKTVINTVYCVSMATILYDYPMVRLQLVSTVHNWQCIQCNNLNDLLRRSGRMRLRIKSSDEQPMSSMTDYKYWSLALISIKSTSEWTLDYPPLFAWFELCLSKFAHYFDENMLQITAKGYISDKTIVFQRLTVIITDFVYFYAVLQWCQAMGKLKIRFSKQCVYDQWFHPNVILAMLFLWNPGLLLVDHIHFQYNGILSALLLLSIARIIQKREIESAFWF